MPTHSAGLLPYRNPANPELFIAHPGGPFWQNRDEDAWSVIKGEYEAEEDPFQAAIREFREETSLDPKQIGKGEFIDLGDIKQKGGKRVRCWGFEVSNDQEITIESNTFDIEWPPNSGNRQIFPEIDRAEFFDPETAKWKLNPAQEKFVDRLLEELVS